MTLGVFVFEGRAATRTVDRGDDNGSVSACTSAILDCNLRGAIDGAAVGDTIEFGAFFDSARVIVLANDGLTINKNLTIIGRGARQLTVQRDAGATNQFPIFTITDGATVMISGMTLTGGNGGIYIIASSLTLDGMNISGNNRPSGGGAIDTLGRATTLKIYNSLISNNFSQSYGGALFLEGPTTIVNTSIVNNTYTDNNPGAAGIFLQSGTPLNMNNVTITGNTSTGGSREAAGGIIAEGGNPVNVRNSIISENTAVYDCKDLRGNFTSNGYNLVRNTTCSNGFGAFGDITDLAGTGGLDGLQNNGGNSDTRLPMMNSLVRDAGDNCVVNLSCAVNNPPFALTTDQRGAGFPRRNGSAVDIGAAEYQAPTAAGATAGGRVTEANGRGIYRILITLTDSQGNQRQVYTNQQGYYSFEDVAGGQVYIFSAFHRRYQFEQPTQVQFIGEEETGINFIGSPSSIFRFDIWNLPTKRIE